MQSTLLQTKPAFSWKALGWALLYFWFFSTLLQAIIYLTGYSGTNGLRDSLLYSSLWLIPVFLFPGRIRVIAAVIGVVLWAASAGGAELLRNLRAGVLAKRAVCDV
ncbi:UPF0141 membrane protein YijP possibly requiredfor phosphoethanolamine modification of lipopolysaccharide [Salmonella enterica subsp. enterica]|nr:UPF0141 membrane protein YijP possibly requiredfor phosphoethanolamine modification of lipopolysaccharide [Salmonella enterica subsp. enterica]